MNNEKSTDVILTDFIKGQRRGRIFSFVVTIVVPLAVLAVMFIGINNISNQYSSAKQEILSELSAKELTLENKEKEVEKLKVAEQISENEKEFLETKLSESEKKYEKLVIDYRILKRNYNKLKKQKGFRTYARYVPKGTTARNKLDDKIVSQIR